jgi:hypothetical protein
MALAAGLALGGAQAWAGDALPVQDADGNGVFSLEEIQAAVPELTAETYAAIDSNADGGVDATELAAAIEAGTIKPAT